MLLLHGDPTSGFSLFGYDLPRIHAVLNDFPSALLVAAVLFEILGLLTRRDSFRAASYWSLIAGTVGAGLAVVSGLLAEDVIAHGRAIHEIMEEHEELAYYTLGIFGTLTVWRMLRNHKMSPKERAAATLLGLIGTGFLVATGAHGGELVFDHAAGTPTEVLEREIRDREAGHQHEAGEEGEDESATSDSLTGPAPSADHVDPPGTPPHEHRKH